MTGRHRPSRWRYRPELRTIWHRAAGSWRAYMLLATATLALGVAIIAGGRMRASAPAWRFVYSLGGPEGFGAVLAALGVALLVAPLISATALRATMMLAAIALLALAFAFLGAALVDPRASWTGFLLYAYLALHLLSHRETYRRAA